MAKKERRENDLAPTFTLSADHPMGMTALLAIAAWARSNPSLVPPERMAELQGKLREFELYLETRG